MKIQHISVDNFKSLVGFEMPLGHFNCLIGLNGAGKSTLLQFFDFLSQQVKGQMDNWLTKRQWKATELNSKLTNRLNIEFTIDFETESNQKLQWTASFNRRELRCTKEKLTLQDKTLLKVEDGQYQLYKEENTLMQAYLQGTIAFEYQGSILSQIKEEQLTDKLKQFKSFWQNLHALDLLSPTLLRQSARDAQGMLGLGGEKLAAFLYELPPTQTQAIIAELKANYPQLQAYEVSNKKLGWKRLSITEQFQNKAIATEARHVNDGLLRMLAIFAQLTTKQSFLLLDEIENGINPELIEFLVDQLVQTQAQTLVTTHSPVILNYLEDEVAKQGLIYLYKNEMGATQAIRLFDIPSMAEKLTVMAPGEVYQDTHLRELYQEIQTLQNQQETTQ